MLSESAKVSLKNGLQAMCSGYIITMIWGW